MVWASAVFLSLFVGGSIAYWIFSWPLKEPEELLSSDDSGIFFSFRGANTAILDIVGPIT